MVIWSYDRNPGFYFLKITFLGKFIYYNGENTTYFKVAACFVPDEYVWSYSQPKPTDGDTIGTIVFDPHICIKSSACLIRIGPVIFEKSYHQVFLGHFFAK